VLFLFLFNKMISFITAQLALEIKQQLEKAHFRAADGRQSSVNFIISILSKPAWTKFQSTPFQEKV